MGFFDQFNRKKRAPTRITIMVPIILSALGVLFLLIGMIFPDETSRFIRQAEPVRGKVIRIDQTNGASEGPIVVAEYQASGRKFTVTSDYSANLSEGSAVTVYYDPDEPSRAVVQTPDSMYMLMNSSGWILLLLGAAFLVQYYRTRDYLEKRSKIQSQTGSKSV